ncbi:acyl-CoA thioesterase [Cloacibacterium sp.]|uniref:acyl-CoA thioesterase n=1 Tax=Cloacibacterium sp. TaxID=1913682 RepID=UPI0039E3F1E4
MKHVHIKEILITKEHLDQMNHVNNVQYVHWVEEMAKEHWDILRHNTNYVDDFWFLADHHIQYKKQVYEGDILMVKTYPQKPDGIRQPRKVEFYKNDELMVDSKTLWVLIDKDTQKIKRIENDWLEF